MPFDPDAYLASKGIDNNPTKPSSSGFDPDAYLASKGISSDNVATPQDAGVGDALARGAGHVAFGEQIGGGLGALQDQITGANPDETLLNSYRRHRDALNQHYKDAVKNHPIASLLGELGGGTALGLATGGLGEAAGLGSVASPILRGAIQGAGDAGLMGASTSDADLTKGQVGQFAGDVGKSAVGGAVVGGVMGKVGDALSSESLKHGANELAVKSLKGSAGQYADLGEEGQQKLGDWLLKNKGVKFGDKAKDSLENIQALKESAGSDMGKIIDEQGAAFDPKALSETAQQQVMPGVTEGTLLKPQINAAQSAIDELATKGSPLADGTSGPISFSQLQQLKSNLGKAAYNPLGSVEKEGLVPVERFLNDQLEGAVDASGDQLPALQVAKGDYGAASKAELLAEKGASRGFANQGFGLGDKTAAIGGMQAMGPKGMLVGALNKLTRERGQSAVAVTMDKLSQLATHDPGSLGHYAGVIANASARGPAALAVTHFLLSQKNQDYREMTDKLSDTSDQH